MRLTFIIILASMACAGCSSSRSPTRLDGSMVDRRLTLSHAHHHAHSEPAVDGRQVPGKVRGCRAQLKLVLTSKAGCSGPLVGQPAARALTVALDLTTSDPTRAEVTDVVLRTRGRSFWGAGTMLLNPSARAAVSRMAHCRGASGDRGPSDLSGHLILSFYADRRRGGDRLGWLEGDFHSRSCDPEPDVVAQLE